MKDICNWHELITPDYGATNKYLYHYTKQETAFEHILHTYSLKLGLLKATNDPHESKSWTWTIKNLPQDQSAGYYNTQINALVKGSCKVCCFTEQTDGNGLFTGQGWSHPRMWAQYADNHKGICMVFDKKALLQQAGEAVTNVGNLYCDTVKYCINPDTPAAFEVEYQSIKEQGVEAAVDNLIKKNYQNYFFTKHPDWMHENEFRMVLHGRSASETYVPVKPSLRAIILGADFPIGQYAGLIEDYAQHAGLFIGCMIWLNGVPCMQDFFAVREKIRSQIQG